VESQCVEAIRARHLTFLKRSCSCFILYENLMRNKCIITRVSGISANDRTFYVWRYISSIVTKYSVHQVSYIHPAALF